MGEANPSGRHANTLAGRLDFLIETIHPAGRGPYTYAEIAEGSRKGEGPSVSHGTVQTIHRGSNTNPGLDSLRAIARFFGVTVGYLADGENFQAVEKRIEERVAQLRKEMERAQATDEFAQALEDENVKAAAFRLSGLSARSIKTVGAFIKQLREVEGLPEVPPKKGRRRKP
ncbi:XRE family transcriptional regulator [Streptomyces sp. NPDC000594]|uniref:XRE family transcriptional regulator n=1 Tax=Streptomyces sp. NPDC000594 TaxID=3154261 RepID=UPI00332D2668